MPNGTTTQGDLARVFVQRGCGTKWVMLGCVGITGIERDPKSLRYELCIDGSEQVKTRIIDQLADPRPYTMTWDASENETRNKIFQLLKRVDNGCNFNLMLAQLECPNPNAVGDPYASDSWTVLYGNYRASSVNFGNNTYRTLDAKNANRFELQTQFAFNKFVYEVPPSFSVLSTLDNLETSETDIDSIAFLDNGRCADGKCVKCGGEGCQIVAVHTNIGFKVSLNGGDTWATSGAAAAAGYVVAYDGKLFKIDRTNDAVYVSLDGTTWTTAIFDVTLNNPTNIVKFDVNYYGIAGADGQFWVSNDGGANWTQVRPLDAAEVDFVHICYNKSNDRLWAVGVVAGGANNAVQYSNDKGKTFTSVTVLATLDNEARIYCADHATFVIIDEDLYVTECDATGNATDLVQRSVIGADGEITGIGACDPSNCNFLYMTTDDGEVFMTIDGGLTWKNQPLPASISLTPNAVLNPVACCHSVNGDKLVFGFGLKLVQTDTPDDYFGD